MELGVEELQQRQDNRNGKGHFKEVAAFPSRKMTLQKEKGQFGRNDRRN